MKKSLLALVVAVAAGSVWAQAQQQQSSYATVKAVEGLVTVTYDNQLTNATVDMELKRGSELLSTSSGKATVQFSNGCRVTVKDGQSLKIEENACIAFLAANPGAAAGITAGLPVSAQLLLGAAGLGLLYDQNRGGGGGGATVVLPVTPGTPVVTPPAPAPVAPPVSGS